MSIHCVAWRPNRNACWLVSSLLLALGCSDDGHRLGGGAEGSAGALRTFGLCSAGADLEAVDDMEDGDGSIDMIAQRGGVWFSFNDKTDGVQQPPSDAETFAMSELIPARSGSHYAAHSQGGGFTFWGAGIGFELYNQKAYDLSGYAGITFWARRAPDSAPGLRFALTDPATAPRGGQCAQGDDLSWCNDYFGAELDLGTEFRRYSFSWQELKQVGWGEPRPSHVNAAQVYGVRFQFAQNEDFDFWVDDIALLCHPD